MDEAGFRLFLKRSGRAPDVVQQVVDLLQRFAALGIRGPEQMLRAGRTPRERQKLAERAGIPEDSVLERVKLSDLARLPGVTGIRARLCFDAGPDTLGKTAACEADEFRKRIVEFVARTGFPGLATLPAGARHTVETARKLPRLVEYSG